MKEYFTPEWIVAIFSVISIAIHYFQNWKLSKKVESYKNDLKKKEIKFNRFNELQIESLKNLYDQIVTFHFKYTTLLDPIFFTHHKLLSNLESVSKEYNICMEYFHRNKIFLTEDLINKIKDIEVNYSIIKVYLKNEFSSLRELEERHGSDDVEDIYGSGENEIESIKKRLSNLKQKDGITSFENEIKGMRKLVEEYFKELTA